MQDSLLWVYEGQTQFWGYVLGARSGMLSKEDTLDAIAVDRRHLRYATPGRDWRPLVDTTNDPIIANRAAAAVAELAAQRGLLQRRPADLARRRPDPSPAVAAARRSMNDFARAFFGMQRPRLRRAHLHVRRRRRDPEPDPALRLGRLSQPRINAYTERPPLEGISRAATGSSIPTRRPTGSRRARRRPRRSTSAFPAASPSAPATASSPVIWDCPAFDAGLTVGSKILAVNGRSFDGDALKRRSPATRSKEPVRLLVKSGDVSAPSISIGTAACATRAWSPPPAARARSTPFCAAPKRGGAHALY